MIHAQVFDFLLERQRDIYIVCMKERKEFKPERRPRS